MTDPVNPYQAPEAAIAGIPAEVRRPPVYTTISWYCWVLGAFHFLSVGAYLYVIARRIDKDGWRQALLYLGWPSPKPLLFLTMSILGTATYLAAGRLLWNRRGLPGLILCGIGILITYLAVWFNWQK